MYVVRTLVLAREYPPVGLLFLPGTLPFAEEVFFVGGSPFKMIF